MAVVRMRLVVEVAEDRENCSDICLDLRSAPMVSARKIACLYGVSMVVEEEQRMVRDDWNPAVVLEIASRWALMPEVDNMVGGAGQHGWWQVERDSIRLPPS